MLVGNPSFEIYSVDPIDGATLQVSQLAPGPLSFAYAADLDDTLYSASFFGVFFRLDEPSNAWLELFSGSIPLGYCYDIAFRYGADGAGFQTVCDSFANSTGQLSTLELLGNSQTAANQLELNTRGLPANVFGFYLMSEQAASLPVGNGLLCLGSPVWRYDDAILLSSADGVARFELDLGQLANGQAATVGDVYNFQFWHRDTVGGMPTSNFSSAVSVTFQ